MEKCKSDAICKAHELVESIHRARLRKIEHEILKLGITPGLEFVRDDEILNIENLIYALGDMKLLK